MDNDGVVSKLGTSGLDTNKPGFKSCMDYWMSIARNYLGSKVEAWWKHIRQYDVNMSLKMV